MSGEAWKDTGSCAECRRKPYCKKQCTANKQLMERIAKAYFIRSDRGRFYPKLAHLVGSERELALMSTLMSEEKQNG